MDKRHCCSSRRAKLVILVIVCLLIQAEGETAERKLPIIDAAKALFSLPTAYDCWVLKVKALFMQQGRPHFSPSNLEGWGKGSQVTTEKVKEAAMKSLDESKSAVEDSARSAAELAEAAVEKTVKKVKNTLSQRHDEA